MHLGDLVEDVARIFRPEALRKGLSLTASTAAGVPEWIEADERRLRQILLNLLGNALSFAPRRSTITVRGTIVRGSSDDEETVRVEVLDQGPGVRPENINSIFERFYSERPTEEAFGNHSGLGLSISKQIIEAHGGQIWAENIRPAGASADTAPSGARFVIELPG